MFFDKRVVVHCPRCYAEKQPGYEQCRSCGSAYSVPVVTIDRKTTLPLDVAHRLRLGGDSDETPAVRLLRFSDAYDEAQRRMKQNRQRTWLLRCARAQATLGGDERRHQYVFRYDPEQTTRSKLDQVVSAMVNYAPELLAWPWVVDA